MSERDAYEDYCEKRRAANQFRTLQTTEIFPEGRAERDGVELINFAGNDYLGLSQHPALIKRARECAAQYGAGATASRLINGNHPLYEAIEKELAFGKRQETALVLNSGYQANVSVLAALADGEALGGKITIFADRLSHNSLLQGAVLSGARLMRFQHNDMEHLERLLRAQEGRDSRALIVTESVFGMDGDRADLAALAGLAWRYDALLYVDEAHATGLFGPHGFGLCSEHGDGIDVAMGTFGKALGSFGAYVACRASLRDYLVQACGGLVYSTALPPAVLGSILAALELIPHMQRERDALQITSARVRDRLRAQGWDCGASTTHIIPVILGDEDAATSLAQTLRENGILAPAIRPPTVPRGTSRLRLSLSAAHGEADIDRLIAVMQEQANRFATAA